MKLIDVFNGDADGICALHQLRLVYPAQSVLVTGVKRDTALLERVQADPRDRVTVMDISLDKNRAALTHLLNLGVEVHYFDHHYAGQVPKHPNLHAMIDTEQPICTSALVDRYIGGQHRAWAVAAAFGDGLHALAERLAATQRLDTQTVTQLRELGECLNYNAYGDTESDLVCHPAELYRMVMKHTDPLQFMRHHHDVMELLRQGRTRDLALALMESPRAQVPGAALYVLPAEPWSRRVRGEFANHLMHQHPERAHAVLTRNSAGGYSVSVRAALAKGSGADQFCLHFDTGGGRPGAAGIDVLSDDRLGQFIAQFLASFGASVAEVLP